MFLQPALWIVILMRVVFPSLGGEKSILEERREISWKASTMTHLDPRTNQCELEVQMIIHLQNLANQL